MKHRYDRGRLALLYCYAVSRARDATSPESQAFWDRLVRGVELAYYQVSQEEGEAWITNTCA